MAELEIIWSDTASAVLHKILTFYNVRNGNTKYSHSVYAMVNDMLRLVAKYPYMYRATFIPDVRVFHCDYFRIYYRVLEKSIFVEAVFDTRQNPEKAPFGET
ncbi:MAG: type II toxin-antitoxin system RelE/ParE family toxin [Bacteroides sp.]|nr:type II toxin-antitoxin system RelE/ParE family toxin [Bacteroides sp.]